MTRIDIINTIGTHYLTENIENGEFSYPKAFKGSGLPFVGITDPDSGKTYEKLDIRFVKDGISVLVETKDDFTLSKNKKATDQLSAYVEYEKALTGNKVIAILANTTNNGILVYRGAVSDSNLINSESKFRTMDEYVEFYSSRVNDKERVMQNTYALNELLHKHAVPEKLRSQFVGTCLLALKSGLEYSNPKMTSKQIRAGIKEKLEDILDGSNTTAEKAYKVGLLYKNVLENQNIRNMDVVAFREILDAIENNILPFINDKSTAGQDLLNLFFITFNKYVGKADKNQAFTPDHITDFMTKITGVNYRSRVLDACCGSGSFLVRAMTTALDDAPTAKDQDKVKRDHIFGIEFDENVYGLATTNMLIHGDGNSNIINGSCFDYRDWIMDTARPNVILMNPPYNCQRVSMDKEYVKTWSASQKEDPSKGLYFVKWLADIINEMEATATMAILLPVACAIGNNSEMRKIKADILKNNTLDAVFTLPNEIFYPGASASACCMVFKLGIPHEKSGKTFFGYYKEDGFRKKKNLGRVETVDENKKSKWIPIEEEWISLYQNREVKTGLSAVAKVSAIDEWLCEAYIESDYSKLSDSVFLNTINNYCSYLVKNGKYPNLISKNNIPSELYFQKWNSYKVGDLFECTTTQAVLPDEMIDGNIPYITRSGENNGRAGTLGNLEKVVLGNCITVGAEGALAFYQPDDFIPGVKVYTVRHPKMNKVNAMFIVSILNIDYYKYSYGRARVLEKLKNEYIKLPTSMTNEPDWQFMEDYIKSLPYGNSL